SAPSRGRRPWRWRAHHCPSRTPSLYLLRTRGSCADRSVLMKLTMLLDMAVEGFGDRVVIGPRGGDLTAARLREMSVAGAAAIREVKADAVVYLAVNGPAFPVAMF